MKPLKIIWWSRNVGLLTDREHSVLKCISDISAIPIVMLCQAARATTIQIEHAVATGAYDSA
jgi:hypothetical protein